eukprot:4403356-Alexandrium_andersonii.AAC.1
MGRGAIPGGPGPRTGTWALGAPRACRARGPVARPRPHGQTSLAPGLAGTRRPSIRAARLARTGQAPPRPTDLRSMWWTTECGPIRARGWTSRRSRRATA